MRYSEDMAGCNISREGNNNMTKTRSTTEPEETATLLTKNYGGLLMALLGAAAGFFASSPLAAVLGLAAGFLVGNLAFDKSGLLRGLSSQHHGVVPQAALSAGRVAAAPTLDVSPAKSTERLPAIEPATVQGIAYDADFSATNGSLVHSPELPARKNPLSLT